MKKAVFFIILFCITLVANAGWTNLNTGINDHLTGVVFWGTNGLVSGSKGLYYTTTGGNGAASWTRFNITTNHADSLLYNRTKFRHCYSDKAYGNSKAFACGIDTVNNRPVVMYINFTAFTYTVVYTGPNNSGGFNKIAFNDNDYYYYVVGDGGKMIKFYYTGASSAIQIPTPYTFNYNSVSFGYYPGFCIGANGTIVNATYYSGTYTFSNTLSSTNTNNDVYSFGTNSGISVGTGYSKWSSSSYTQNSNYDFGPLNGRGLCFYNNKFFVGTDHGIFRSTSSNDFFEWQPSSLNYKINAIWISSNSGALMYACGENGVVLSSSDQGGLPKPFAKLDLPGGCVGATIAIDGIKGSSTNCKWYINNALSYSNCSGSFNHVFNSVGQYTIQLNVDNGPGLYDTAVQVIHIVDYPEINKSVSISKSVLCHQEAITVTVDSAQQDVYYVLKMIGNSASYGNSAVGAPTPVSFNSSVLSTGGNYYLQANSSLAACYNNFTDTVQITVEKTTADFHVATLNAAQNESLNCFDLCTDAQNYHWTFSPNGASSNASVATPSVSFPSPGPTQIKLVAWSNNGCYDSIQKNGPKIYVDPVGIDSCWTMVNNGRDLPWGGSSYLRDDISGVHPTNGGFITHGTYYDEAIASRYGDSLRFPYLQHGCFLARYNTNGVLKWVNYSKQTTSPNNTSISPDQVISAIEDKNGNIYACGYSADFKDNTGTVYSNYLYSYNNWLYKLDSTGKMIWRINKIPFFPPRLYLDHAGDVYLTGGYLSVTTSTLLINGQTTFTYTNNQPSNDQIWKFSPAGNLLWVNSFSVAPNGSCLSTITFDKDNNLYVTGTINGSVTFYTAPGSTSTQQFTAPTGVIGTRMFLAKYNSNGVLQWKARSRTLGVTNDATIAWAAVTDSLGNTYITGTNQCEGTGETHIFENTNGTTTSATVGHFYVAKINNVGICKWIRGTHFSYTGYGYGIAEDNNEIATLGRIYNSSTTTLTAVTTTFTSTNGVNLTFTVDQKNYFVSIYDTLGNIKRVIANSATPNLVSMDGNNGFTGFYKTANSTYRLSRNFQSYVTHTNFSDIVGPPNGTDGSITTFVEDCGVITYPNIATSLNEQLTTSLQVYPNPAHNLVYIKDSNGSENLSVKLMSVTGQQVPCNYNNGSISLENLSSGMYFLLIYKDNKLYHQQKIIKE